MLDYRPSPAPGKPLSVSLAEGGFLRRFGWFVLIVGLVWTLIGADNILNDSIAAWRFHRWEMATKSVRENGVFYGLSGLTIVAIGTIILLREWWKRL